MKDPIRRGSVMWVPDAAVQMPPDAHRQMHAKRPVLVLSGDASNDDASWPIILAAPITSSDYSTEFDVKVGANQGGLSKKGWIRIPLIQPIAKTDVLERAGQLDAAIVAEVIARWLRYTGSI